MRGSQLHQRAVGFALPLVIIALPVLAGDRAVTVAGCHSPTCSPKDDLVAYVHYGVRADGTVAQDLYAMNLDGTRTWRLSTASMVWDPSFNKDGTAVVCSAVRLDEPGRAGLWVIAVPQGTPRMLVQYSSATAPFAPAFSPTGDAVAFIRSEDDSGRRAAIWKLDSLRGVTDMLPLHHTLTLSQAGGLMWMPDGVNLRFLAVEARGTDHCLGLFEINTENEKVRSVYAFEPDEAITDPAMSPDGKAFAYIRHSASGATLMVREETQPEPRPLAPVVVAEKRIACPFESDVCFTRDSEAVVYVSGTDLRMCDLTATGRGASPVFVDECHKHLEDIRDALQIYSVGHDGRLPAPAEGDSKPEFWVNEIWRALSKPESIRCPSDSSVGVTSYVFPLEMHGRAWSEIKDTKEVLVREREPRHGPAPLRILGDGTVLGPTE